MSRIHSLGASTREVASIFNVPEAPEVAVPTQVVEGCPGVVIFEAGGKRRLRSMRWGFPRSVPSGDDADLIGLVADLTNPLWEETVGHPRYRCIIPITHFANPRRVGSQAEDLVFREGQAGDGVGWLLPEPSERRSRLRGDDHGGQCGRPAHQPQDACAAQV